jgi:teichuronic acid biosynthesis glycosyltransferase TuaC
VLKVLTLSTLFPSAMRRQFGLFVERQTRALAVRPGVELEVVAPLGVPWGPLARHPHWLPLTQLPVHEMWNGLAVHRPRFPLIPFVGAATPLLMARTLLPLLREIRARFPFQVIDAEFFFPDGPACIAIGQALGVPVSIKARGSDIHHWANRFLCRSQILRAGRAAQGLLAVSAALKEQMGNLGLPTDRIRVHYTGVDLQFFRPAPDREAAKAALGIRGRFYLSVGSLIPLKRHHLAIEAMALLPDATLWIAGEGPERGRLQSLITALGLNDRVRLLGSRTPEQLAELGAASDVGVLFSSSEGLANAWIESLASGAPVVTCDVGGAREVINRREAGRLVAPDPLAIAAALTELTADPPEAQRVRAVAERFSWQVNAEHLVNHLRSLVVR